MIMEEEREIILSICSMQKKADGTVMVLISRDHGVRISATTGFTTMFSNLSKSAIESDLNEDVCVSVSTDKLRSIITWMPCGDLKAKLNGTTLSFSFGKTHREIAVADSLAATQELFIDEDTVEQVQISDSASFLAGLRFAGLFKHKDQERGIGYVHLSIDGNIVNFIGTDAHLLGFYIYRQKIKFPKCDILVGDCQLSAMISAMEGSQSCMLSIDGTGKYGVSGKNVSMIGAQPLLKPAPSIEMLKLISPRKPSGIRSDTAKNSIIEKDNIKRALSHCTSIFVRDENPVISIEMSVGLVEINARSLKGYDSVHEEFQSVCESEKRFTISPVLLQKAVSCYDSAVEICWEKDAAASAPIIVSQPGEEVGSFIVVTQNIVKNEKQETE